MKPSKFCWEHEGEKSSSTAQQLDIRPATRSYCKLIANTATTLEGCKKIASVKKYLERTAGMFYIFRPCGIRIAHAEMYTCESCSDVFVLLVDTFGLNPSSEDVRAIVYDRSCDLHPFIKRLSGGGNTAAEKFKAFDFMIDGFHVKGHIEPKCNIEDPRCAYHPELEQFSIYKGMNTEIAEQSFNDINEVKYSTRKMSMYRRMLFFMFLDDSANIKIEKKCNKME